MRVRVVRPRQRPEHEPSGLRQALSDHGADSFRAVYRSSRGRVPPWAMPLRTAALLVLIGLALASAVIFATDAAALRM